tara:strand:- start:2032 stop:2133 length:102 start_codon:yes stop_codon:yes gene_type:complete
MEELNENVVCNVLKEIMEEGIANHEDLYGKITA